MDNKNIQIAWVGKHFGEEPPLVGNNRQGAGGIFFSGCNLRCVFCQNWQISQGGMGKKYSVGELAEMMLQMQANGAINIDLVTPTIWWREIKDALMLAKSRGLNLPIVWNSNAYEHAAILKQLEGLVDIYLPDFKYGDDEAAVKYSRAHNYTAVARAAIKEMLRQTGILQINQQGIAVRGVLVRHLILPNNINNSLRALEILKAMEPRLPISLMRQYYPLHQAKLFPEINRMVTDKEFNRVFDRMWELGFTDGWAQDNNSEKNFVPDFTRLNPFASINNI